MDFDQFQKRCQKTARPPLTSQRNCEALNYAILALAGEAGELANVWKKALRDGYGYAVGGSDDMPRQGDGTLAAGTLLVMPDRRDQLLEELGDVLYYVAAVASCLLVPLDDVAKENIEKLAGRYDVPLDDVSEPSQS